MKVLANNKKAFFDYEFLEKFQGGLMLTGAEVKSAKMGRMQLQGAFLHIQKGELWLKNSTIAKYEPAGIETPYDALRDRKVLVHKRELHRMAGKIQTAGLTLVPIHVYIQRNLLKLEFALARGKKQYEKREAIKKRDIDRQLRERMRE